MKANILFLWGGLEKVGGVETFLYQCLKGLPQFGLTPYILDVGKNRGSLHSQFTNFSGQVIRARLKTMTDLKNSGVMDYICSLGIKAIVLNSWEFKEILQLANLTIPIISIVHNDRPSFYEDARHLHDKTRALVGVSRTICNKIMAVLPAGRTHIVHYIPYGVERPPLRLWSANFLGGKQPLRVVYHGRFQQEQKRIMDLVPFVDALNARAVECELNLIGEGPDQKQLRTELISRKGTVKTTFFGPLGHDSTMRCLKKQDICLLFSEFEGLPISLLEALRRGIVPVVSRVSSGVSEILTDALDARIFPIGRPELAAEIVAELAHDAPQLLRLKKAAKVLGDTFRPERMLQSYSKLIWATVQKCRSVPPVVQL